MKCGKMSITWDCFEKGCSALRGFRFLINIVDTESISNDQGSVLAG